MVRNQEYRMIETEDGRKEISFCNQTIEIQIVCVVRFPFPLFAFFLYLFHTCMSSFLSPAFYFSPFNCSCCELCHSRKIMTNIGSATLSI